MPVIRDENRAREAKREQLAKDKWEETFERMTEGLGKDKGAGQDGTLATSSGAKAREKYRGMGM